MRIKKYQQICINFKNNFLEFIITNKNFALLIALFYFIISDNISDARPGGDQSYNPDGSIRRGAGYIILLDWIGEILLRFIILPIWVFLGHFIGENLRNWLAIVTFIILWLATFFIGKRDEKEIIIVTADNKNNQPIL